MMSALRRSRVGRTIGSVLFAANIYISGGAMALAVKMFRWARRLEVVGLENLFQEGPTIVAYTHPTAADPATIGGLFGKVFMRDPHRTPWSTPDKKNFWIWIPVWVRCIFIPRGSPAGVNAAFRIMRGRLRLGETITISPEAGRTSSGEKLGEEFEDLGHGLRIREFKKGGIGRLVEWVPDVTIVPVLVQFPEDSRNIFVAMFFPPIWRKMRIIVGTPYRYSKGVSRQEVIDQLRAKYRALAATIKN